MTKIKITQTQYNAILLREQQSRLKASSNILNENIATDPELLEEGWKEVVLGVAMMLGVGLTGQNKAMAQDAVKNASTMAQIKATLEDSSKVAELSDLLEKKGMKNADEKLADNAEQVMDQFNDIAKHNNIKYHVDTKVVTNLQGLKGKLNQGYALKNAEISNDTTHATQQNQTVLITDTMEINLGSDNLFVTGGFTLSPAGKDTIKMAIEEIAKQGGKIQSVEIESSTDAEEIVKFMTKDDPTGNIKLSNLRTQAISNELSSLGVNNDITHREIPNNGSDVVNTQQFLKVAKDPKATAMLREKTSEFRYVKLKIVATFETKPEKDPTDITTVVHKYRFELVKVTESTGKARKIKTSTHFKQKKFKCKRPKGDHSPIKCSFER
jgi:outer membrane protein OmpA-like peptidoglycan-associated protein